VKRADQPATRSERLIGGDLGGDGLKPGLTFDVAEHFSALIIDAEDLWATREPASP
jgi:hypothetical protein